jgi:hypothetical protein
MEAYLRNPSRRYIESLEARVASLGAIVNTIRDADSTTLPQLLQELRSHGEDFQYYCLPIEESGFPNALHKHVTSFANDTTGSPLIELGKVMGTLQLEEGQVLYQTLEFRVHARFDILDLPPIYHSSLKIHNNFLNLLNPSFHPMV